MPILFQFDVRAIALFVAMTFFIQAMAIGAQAYLIREFKQYRGVRAALVANLCAALGLILRLFADQLPEFLSVILSNILLLTGPSLFYIALSQFTGFPYNKALIVGMLTTVVVFLSYFTYWDANITNRVITFSLGSLVVVSLLIYQLWRIQKTSLRLSANLMLASFAIHAIFLIARMVSVIRNPPQDSLSLTPALSATYLFSFAISFFWTTGFVLLVSHRLRNDLMEIATIDVLTRVPNRRATQAFLEKEISRAQRQNGEFSVLLIDIDNFKQVNDRWGHSVGDDVLVGTARLFLSMIRKQDLVGRWGGEEFLIIIPGPSDAEMLAERIRSEIAAAEYNHGDGLFHITVSIGIACATPTSLGHAILKQADDALYHAKTIKNTIKMANEV